MENFINNLFGKLSGELDFSDSKQVICAIAISLSPLLLVLAVGITIIFLHKARNLKRAVSPTQKAHRALQIAREDPNDIVYVRLQYSPQNDEIAQIEQDILRLQNKCTDNLQKKAVMEAGYREFGAFSKEKTEEVRNRIAELKAANFTMQHNIRQLDTMRAQMLAVKAHREGMKNRRNCKTNDAVQFGKNNWVVMQVQDQYRLLLCASVVNAMPDKAGWCKGGLRDACEAFYQQFTKSERQWVCKTVHHTAGESQTTSDYVFVLSPQEVLEFMKNPHLTGWRGCVWNDELKETQEWFAEHGLPSFDHGWWLRSADGQCIYMDSNGNLQKNTYQVDICGFKPAMWIKVP